MLKTIITHPLKHDACLFLPRSRSRGSALARLAYIHAFTGVPLERRRRKGSGMRWTLRNLMIYGYSIWDTDKRGGLKAY